MAINLDELVRGALLQGASWDALRDAVERHRDARPVPEDETDVQVGDADAGITMVLPDWSVAGAAGPRPPDTDSRFPLEPASGPLVPGLPRYIDLGYGLGSGGMGSVRRVRDRRLGRDLAMKIIHPWAAGQPGLLARFLEEAQATAQLQHPGIIPIHDLGELADGRLWFTMKEVTGETLGAVIRRVHTTSSTRWTPTADGWSLRRLVTALQRACDAVGHAHARGVLHRDLKPANIMVGAHGEVIVLDWGLAKLTGTGAWAEGATPVETVRSRAEAHPTMVGQVSGTPAYMAPEQALGRTSSLDARTDVYALGATLYEVLSGRPPYEGETGRDVLDQVRSQPPASLLAGRPAVHFGRGRTEAPAAGRPPLPPVLVAACERAMARDPADRFESAGELASELEAWLDGSKRAEDGRAVVALAKGKRPEAAALRSHARALRAEAGALLEGVEDWHPEDDKVPGWAKEDEAAALEKQAELLELEEEQLLQASLTHAADLPEAHAALAARYQAEHAACEAVRADTTRAEALLRQHLAALSEDHPAGRSLRTYLQGDGALTLVTDPPGAEVLLHRYVLHRRRLVPRFVRSLGRTPLRAVPLPMGSYLCILRHPGRADVRYPVAIGRGEHWHGVPPHGGDPHPIPMPPAGELGADDCYVPPGWFQCGGDPHHEQSLSARRLWAEGQVVRRLQVDHRRYIAFLDALVADGRAEDALRFAPREQAGAVGGPGALIYGFDGARFSLVPDADGSVWEPAWPVMMVNYPGAAAYAAWEATRTGVGWRIPRELDWEKAARGVDGRFYPWGDGFDPSWCCMRRSHAGPIRPSPVGAFPVDESPYGVRDLAGGCRDWCSDAFDPDGQPDPDGPATSPAGTPIDADLTRVIRGGAWVGDAGYGRIANRDPMGETARRYYIGFRLARAYP